MHKDLVCHLASAIMRQGIHDEADENEYDDEHAKFNQEGYERTG